MEINAFTSHIDHLRAELSWLNLIIQAMVKRLRNNCFYEKASGFAGLFISDEEVDSVLNNLNNSGTANRNPEDEYTDRLIRTAAAMRATIDERLNKSVQEQVFIPFAQLRQVFRLNEFERQVFTACLAPQIDFRYARLFAYLQNNMALNYPTIDLLLMMFCHEFEERIANQRSFFTNSLLFKYRLLEAVNNENDGGRMLLSSALRLCPDVYSHLTTLQLMETVLGSQVQVYHTQVEWDDLSILPEQRNLLINLLINYANQNLCERTGVIFSFYGADERSQQDTAALIGKSLNLPLLVVDAEAFIGNADSAKTLAAVIFRDSMLLPALPFFKNIDCLFARCEGNGLTFSTFSKLLEEYSFFSFISSKKRINPIKFKNDQLFVELEFPRPNYTDRQGLWQRCLQKSFASNGSIDISAIASKFKLSSGQIAQAVHMAEDAALMHDVQKPHLSMDDVVAACRNQSNQKLGSITQKITPKYHWIDIILPKDQLDQLKEIVSYIHNKHVVYEQWGFERKLSLGKGLNVLFSGPSGTGKTMAAEIIAHELNMDLYKIDLSTVVSKYIGETEKNLNQIFVEAETANAILFFDEADALFGKRSEVRDAHDRYANIEIGYLLQKMEEHTGVVILATNLRKNLDEAFTRRMNFMVEFPFPDEQYRLSIWQNIFPKETPLSAGIDFEFLARKFKLTGGSIRNIAISSAFYAAENGQAAAMEYLLLATKRELQKMGKECSPADFGEYYSLVQN